MGPVLLNVDITSIIRNEKWILGAVNYDEDLHFSSYYLRASTSKYTKDLYPGYTKIISFYNSFNEKYYLLENECFLSSKEIIEKAENQPEWLFNILNQIETECYNLKNIFKDYFEEDYFKQLSDKELINIYKKHNKQQFKLYRFARLPEALDRGNPYFTKYLISKLERLSDKKENLYQLFLELTKPINSSVLYQSINEFNQLLKLVKQDNKLTEYLKKNHFKSRFLLNSSIRKKIMDYHNKWKYLKYHGYGGRSLESITQILQRISRNLDSYIGSQVDIGTSLENEKRNALFDKYNIPEFQRKLFEIYSEIGRIKLLRRYIQLRNFYYLDILIEEIACRLNCSEWIIRNMLPEEIIQSFKTKLITEDIKHRSHGCAYLWIDGRESIVTGEEMKELLSFFDEHLLSHDQDKELRGIVACRGHTIGKCKIIIRAQNLSKQFEKGMILVSHSTDPDLLDFIKDSSAVLTEQGGVTSHAALICRELSIPTIVGIKDLLSNVSDGDTLEVDAENGVVRVRTSKNVTEFIIYPSLATKKPIGNKARNLIKLKEFSYEVPEFIILDYNKIDEIIANADTSKKDEIKDLIAEKLNLREEDLVAIRSSSEYENHITGSGAGKFESIVNVEIDLVYDELKRFILLNKHRTDNEYKGSIIVQRMLKPEFSGVCITKDDRLEIKDTLVIEFIAGNNILLTKGKTIPNRCYFFRDTSDLKVEMVDELKELDIDLGYLVREFIEVEKNFSYPMDIEWAVEKGKLFILQARPLVRK